MSCPGCPLYRWTLRGARLWGFGKDGRGRAVRAGGEVKSRDSSGRREKGERVGPSRMVTCLVWVGGRKRPRQVYIITTQNLQNLAMHASSYSLLFFISFFFKFSTCFCYVKIKKYFRILFNSMSHGFVELENKTVLTI